MADRVFNGVEIHDAWPSAALFTGASRPSYERWEAFLPDGRRVAGFTLPEIRDSIAKAVG
jgi:hypothetical protein